MKVENRSLEDELSFVSKGAIFRLAGWLEKDDISR